VLDGKLEILSADLCYADPDADLCAKNIRLGVLKEFVTFARDDRLQSCCRQLDMIIDAIEAPVFRSRPPISSVYFRVDDTPQYQEPSWAHLALHYQILKSFIENAGNNTRFDVRYAGRLILAFDSPDFRERKSLATLVLTIGKQSRTIMPHIFKMVLDCLAGYRDGSHSHFCVAPALLVVTEYVLPKLSTGRDHPLVLVYINYILPLIKGRHFAHFQDIFVPLAEMFLRTGTKPVLVATCHTIVVNFPFSHYKKATTLLNLLTTTLSKMRQEELKSNMRTILRLYARCATWGNANLCRASYQIWNRPELFRRIQDDAPALLPLVFPIIWTASKTPWLGAIAETLSDTLAAMARMNPVVCQNLRNEGNLSPPSVRMSLWKSLAKFTARRDPQFNLDKWEDSLTKTASTGVYEPKHQPCVGRAETDPTSGLSPVVKVGPARTLSRVVGTVVRAPLRLPGIKL
jgi:serine/threonine-protein phosphatase 2A regulatory subunit B'